jgi:hypothetical protein
LDIDDGDSRWKRGICIGQCGDVTEMRKCNVYGVCFQLAKFSGGTGLKESDDDVCTPWRMRMRIRMRNPKLG